MKNSGMNKSALQNFANDKVQELNGGGYTFNLKDQIAGHPAVKGYDDVAVHNVVISGGKMKNHTKKNNKAKKGKKVKKTKKYMKSKKSGKK